MDKTGAPGKHFQHSTKLGRVTSQKTSLETGSMFHSMSTTSQKLQYLNIQGPSTHSVQIPAQPISCWLPIHLCTVGCYRYTVCTIRPLQLIVINMPHSRSYLYNWLLQICHMHIQMCTAAGYRYAVCMFRYIQPVILDTPIIKMQCHSAGLS